MTSSRYVRLLGAASALLLAGAALTSCVPEGPATATPNVTSPAAPVDATPTAAPLTPSPAEPSPVPSAQPEGLPVTIITAGAEQDGIEATAIVLGVVDPAATCTLTASRGSVSSSVEVTVNPSGGNSYCPLMLIPASQLTAGTWTLAVEYRSGAGGGRSASQTVVVP